MEKRGNGSRIGRISSIIDKLTFFHILLIWTALFLVFGLAYHLLAGANSHLVYEPTKTRVVNILDSIYFSFITATSTGFGDITPVGYFKILSIFEVVIGLVFLALVTSKLVSIKQDVIMNEIYEISFSEKINRIRSSLLVFRQNISRVISNIESNTFRNREISDLYTYLSSLEDNLTEISKLISKKGGNGFTKSLDPTMAELLFHSITQSFERLNEMISVMSTNKIMWRRKITLSMIERCLEADKQLFEQLHSSRIISEKEYNDLYLHNKKAIEPINGCLDAPDDSCKIEINKDYEGD